MPDLSLNSPEPSALETILGRYLARGHDPAATFE